MTIHNQTRLSFHFGLAAACLFTLTNSATAGERSNLLACAQGDIRAITLIDDRAAANSVAPEKLHQAYLTVMSARVACSEGRIREGVALYDSVAVDLVLAQGTQ